MGIWACGKSGVEIKTPDHSGMVWDEMLAFWFILMMIYPTSWFYQILAFILFRFFDIVKPGPIAWVDQFFKNWQSFEALLSNWHIFQPTFGNVFAIGQIFIVVNGKILSK